MIGLIVGLAVGLTRNKSTGTTTAVVRANEVTGNMLGLLTLTTDTPQINPQLQANVDKALQDSILKQIDATVSKFLLKSLNLN